MSAAAEQPTTRQRIESILRSHPGRGVALTHFYELLPDVAASQVQNAFKSLMKCGTVIRHGTTRYPDYQLVREGDPLHRPDTARVSKPRVKAALATAVTWPADVKVQHWPTSSLKPPSFTGIDWSRVVLRPGCQDHQLVPSRRGEVRVLHRGPMGIFGARERREPTA